MDVRLVVVQGKPEGKEIAVRGEQFIVGRDPRCQLRPASEAVSKLHCAILQRDGRVYLRDLRSTNGTFVNNDRIAGEVELRDGDLIRVTSLVFAVKIPCEAVCGVDRPSSEEDQAAEWLLDTPGAAETSVQANAKTTIVNMPAADPTPLPVPKGASESTVPEPALLAVPGVAAAAKGGGDLPKKSNTAEFAGDLLERLLDPRSRKKRSK